MPAINIGGNKIVQNDEEYELLDSFLYFIPNSSITERNLKWSELVF